jgi:hypothetical protein
METLYSSKVLIILCGCESWSPTVKEYRLKVVESKVLGGIFGGVGGWRILHNEELHNLYSSPNINRMIK